MKPGDKVVCKMPENLQWLQTTREVIIGMDSMPKTGELFVIREVFKKPNAEGFLLRFIGIETWLDNVESAFDSAHFELLEVARDRAKRLNG